MAAAALESQDIWGQDDIIDEEIMAVRTACSFSRLVRICSEGVAEEGATVTMGVCVGLIVGGTDAVSRCLRRRSASAFG
jgi:hypothetical protein